MSNAEPRTHRVIEPPILEVDGILIASVQEALDDEAVLAFEHSLLKRIAEAEVLGVVIDVTAVDVLDSFMARCLDDMALAVGLLGARLAVVGIQPPVAITLLKMGFTIPNAMTGRDLQQGMGMLRRAGPPSVETVASLEASTTALGGARD